ncbi:Uncharacterised protein [Shigella sonnei]|nr:Uncharacterised protein [Shigella sonnei]
MNGVNQRRNGATDPDTNRANQQDCQRCGNQHNQHWLEEVFGHRRCNAIHPAFDI